MARSATGSQSVYATSWTVPSTAQHVVVLIKNTAPPSYLARVYEATGQSIWRDGTSGNVGDWHFKRKFSTTSGEWMCSAANAGVDLSGFSALAWYQDGTRTSAAEFSVNGSAKTVSTVTTPSGSVVADPATKFDLLNSNGRDRAWGSSGAIAWFGVWSRKLSSGELAGFAAGTIPLAGCVHFYSLDATNGLKDLINSAGDLTNNGTSLVADPATALLLWAAPAAVIVGTATESSVALSWAAYEGAASYVLERAPVGNDTWTVIATPTGTGYTDIGLMANTGYRYRLRARQRRQPRQQPAQPAARRLRYPLILRRKM